MAILCILLIISPVLSSRVLYLAPVNASSHDMWNGLLATELAKRGHEITYITSAEIKNESHPNIKLQYFQQSQRLIAWQEDILAGQITKSPNVFKSMSDKIYHECEEMLENGPYKDLINSYHDYDLIIFEYIGHDCLLALSHKFKSAPIIIVAASSHMPIWYYRILGAPIFHVSPHVIDWLKPPMDFWKRLQSLNRYIKDDLSYFLHAQPAMNKLIQTKFGEEVQPLQQLWKKVALLLTNTADWMNKIPIPPNIVPIGGMHLKDSQPLNQLFLEFMDGADDGVILVSFGMIFPLETNLGKFRVIASALEKLPQRILWKWDQESDFNITFPKNVLKVPWIPQNDLLGHTKLILFVSHCGAQSTLEAMYHGVPVLAVPGFWDQSENANRIVAQNAGLRLDFYDITQEKFLETSRELITNKRKAALQLKTIIRGEPIKPLERAIFWVEFVIRHKGAAHLRPLTWDLPHPLTLLFDVTLLVVAATLAILLLVIVLLYLLCVTKKVLCQQILPKHKTE